MNKKLFFLFLAAVCCMAGSFAQRQAIAPRDSVKALFGGNKIFVNYGKPLMEGRKIFGEFVPYYKIWRTGNGSATTLTTDADLEIDGAVVSRGTYSLYTFPAQDKWKLIINKQTGQWGTVYNPQFDLARVDLDVKPLKSAVEALTFRIEKRSESSGILHIAWEKTELSAGFQISKDGLLPSPRDSVSINMEGTTVSINYGRPSMRGRKNNGRSRSVRKSLANRRKCCDWIDDDRRPGSGQSDSAQGCVFALYGSVGKGMETSHQQADRTMGHGAQRPARCSFSADENKKTFPSGGKIYNRS